MNKKIIAKYLQFLRTSNNYTQKELASKLDISRQAVSKWETETTLPDLDVLLKLSKLFGITINDLLEPKVYPRKISDFEEISTIPESELKTILQSFDVHDIVTALLGASPETNYYIEKLYPDIDFEQIQNTIGRIKIDTVEDMQNQIIAMINLLEIE